MKLNTIKQIYRALNSEIFNGLLDEPVMLCKRWRDAHAQHVVVSNGPNRLEFNLNGIKGLAHATAVVYHEMIHQYIEEILHLDEDDHHGPIFWQWYEYLAPCGIELGEHL